MQMAENRVEEIQKTLRGWVLHNLPLKILSVVLAALLWHQVSSQQTVQREVTIPVEFVNMPLDLEIVNEYVREVDVVVRSDRGGSLIEERQLSAVVDLAQVQAGVELVQLTEDNISRAAGLEILRINPTQIRLALENTLTKIVKIEPVLTGTPGEGFQLTDVKVVPPEIVVSGPETLIHQVSVAGTGVVDISGATTTVTAQTFVDLDQPRLRIGESASVSVVAVIEEKRRAIRVAGVPVQVRPAGVNFRLYDETVELRGTVPQSFAGQLDPQRFQAVVDIGPLPAASEPHQVKPEVSIPEEYASVFRLESSRPEVVRVRKAS